MGTEIQKHFVTHFGKGMLGNMLISGRILRGKMISRNLKDIGWPYAILCST
jgi:hypothetical protein